MPIENISTPERFSAFLKQYNNVLCLYYWKHCGHCIAFSPVWNKITKLYEDKINVINVELECSQKLQDKYRVLAFPTVVIYRNGKKEAEFLKERTEKNLDEFIKKHALAKKPLRKRRKSKQT